MWSRYPLEYDTDVFEVTELNGDIPYTSRCLCYPVFLPPTPLKKSKPDYPYYLCSRISLHMPSRVYEVWESIGDVFQTAG
jgi:hypothetical protein